jgi:hypothetical protein
VTGTPACHAQPLGTIGRHHPACTAHQQRPVVLDARTGADRSDEPGIAPFVVDAYWGIALDKGGGQVLRAYPAVG